MLPSAASLRVSAVSSVTAGSESILGAARTVFRASAASTGLGVALGGYTGGVCSLERWRGKRDFINPFIVGGIGGALGAIQRVQIHDGQTKRTVLAFSGRGLMAGSASSALLCSVFWYLQQPSRAARESERRRRWRRSSSSSSSSFVTSRSVCNNASASLLIPRHKRSWARCQLAPSTRRKPRGGSS